MFKAGITLLSMAMLCSWGSSLVARGGRKPSPQKQPANLKITIKPEKDVYRIGDPIRLRVQIENIGQDPLYIGNHIPTYDWIYHLEFIVADERGHVSQATHFFNPNMPDFDPRESELSALTKDWIVIPPGTFFGSVVTLLPSLYSSLGTPGAYEIGALYTSEGLDANTNYNRLASSTSFLEQLPYKAWTGTLKTNEVKIRLLSTTKAPR